MGKYRYDMCQLNIKDFTKFQNINKNMKNTKKHEKHKDNMRGAFAIFNITFSTGFILHWVINLQNILSAEKTLFS